MHSMSLVVLDLMTGPVPCPKCGRGMKILYQTTQPNVTRWSCVTCDCADCGCDKQGCRDVPKRCCPDCKCSMKVK